MARRRSKKELYGDYCFREPFLHRHPDDIRRELDERARAEIIRSVNLGIRP